MDQASDNFIHAGSLDALKAKGHVVLSGRRCPLLVLYDNGRVRAVDNRCPHLGFPLHRGSVEDGILTCHWHHARFDLESGGTFDPWADDLPTCAVDIRDGEVWVEADCAHKDPVRHWRRRLNDGVAHNIRLVIAKSLIGARDAGIDPQELVRDVALFGVKERDSWGAGLTVLTAMANLARSLPEEQAYLALFHGMRRVAMDCDGAAPHRPRESLGDATTPLDVLKRWLRHWMLVRHRDGAERTLLTAISGGATPGQLADLLLTAISDRYFADGGHALDFVNKAFECLDLIGWNAAPEVLPSVVENLISARGSEELNAWRHPVDLVPLLESAFSGLPKLLQHGSEQKGEFVARHEPLTNVLLGDEPEEIVSALTSAISDGAQPTDLSRSLLHAAALRVARFGTSNEFSDWDSAHHVFTYANAVHRLITRLRDEGSVTIGGEHLRSVFHGAMALYLIRFLNVPPAPPPDERRQATEDLPHDGSALCERLLDAFDRQQQVGEAARIVAHYLDLGHSCEPLIDALALALLREDAGFHSYQMLEAGVAAVREWGPSEASRDTLTAAARYLAAHSPTERAQYQTARIARRLMRGGQLHEDEAAEVDA